MSKEETDAWAYVPKHKSFEEGLKMLADGGYTIAEVAKACGMSQQTIRKWKKEAQRSPTAEAAAMIQPEPETNDTARAEGTGAVTVEAVQAASESPAAERPPVCEPQKALSEDETHADEQPAAAAVTSTAAASAVAGATSVAASASVPMKPNPLFVETKSKHVQLLMQPSLHDKVKKLAARNGLSLNEFIHKVLEAL